MPADLARHLACLARSRVVAKGWRVDGVFHGGRLFGIPAPLNSSTTQIENDHVE
jgi:hypothetical protein